MENIKVSFRKIANTEFEVGDIVEFYVDISEPAMTSTDENRVEIRKGERFKIFSIIELSSIGTSRVYTLLLPSKEEVIQVTQKSMYGAKVFKKVVKSIPLNLAPELSSYLLESLDKAARNKSFVETAPHHRNIGKTTAVIEYARQIDATAIVPNFSRVKDLATEHNYSKIVRAEDVPYLIGGKFVYDEEVDLDKIVKALDGKSDRFNFVTGFKKVK